MHFRSTCPVSNILDIVGDKWSLLIIRDLFIGRNTYSDFLESPEQISTNILVDRLKKLIQFGLIEFTRNEQDKKIKHYNLTSKGVDLYPMLAEMAVWSRKNLDVEFHPLSVEMFNDVDAIGLEKHISNTIEGYKKQLNK